ncbi:hypothetical protein [Kurthia sibirica]|uniref:Uncharacterized protein n=1 Tax=Kurthia sibirica TaxID=202750 RepID=A0A2U3AMX3_9BACL|nr:hypothetical protein [Kurthia sibirica]PWI25861.1 hypothetical protein DEX24_06570 [Kurthia sibirica]GEK34298.1 hypothetical protein KSI01_18310 [Kurthia sibirica]
MGYILPITPYQSMQYAAIQQMGTYNYSHIEHLQRVKKQSHFEKELERHLDRATSEQQKIERMNQLHLPYSMPIIIQPPKEKSIAEITGKGNIVNTYV